MSKYLNISDMKSDKYILKEDLFTYVKEHTNYDKDSSVRWVIHEMVREKELTKIDSEYYYLGQLKEYQPLELSKNAKKIQILLQKHYPELDFVIYESRILNEWLNHQIARNVIFVETEKYYMEFVFQYLKEHYQQRVLYSPSYDNFNLYSDDGIIVVQNLITRSPLKKNSIEIRIEKLIVDLFSTDLVSKQFSPTEYETILQGIFSKYKVNTKKVISYAKRRNLSETVGKYIAKYFPKNEHSYD